MCNLFQLKRLQTFFHIQFLFICLFFLLYTGRGCITNQFPPEWCEPAWQFHRFWQSGRWFTGPCAVSVLQAMSARCGSGDSGTHIKEDRFIGLQEEMDQQHTLSPQSTRCCSDCLCPFYINTTSSTGTIWRLKIWKFVPGCSILKTAVNLAHTVMPWWGFIKCCSWHHAHSAWLDLPLSALHGLATSCGRWPETESVTVHMNQFRHLILSFSFCLFPSPRRLKETWRYVWVLYIHWPLY